MTRGGKGSHDVADGRVDDRDHAVERVQPRVVSKVVQRSILRWHFERAVSILHPDSNQQTRESGLRKWAQKMRGWWSLTITTKAGSVQPAMLGGATGPLPWGRWAV